MVGVNLLFLKPCLVGGTETYACSLMQEFNHLLSGDSLVLFINRQTRRSGLFDGFPFQQVVCEIDGQNTYMRCLYEQTVLPGNILRSGCDLVHSLGYLGPINCPRPHVVTIHDTNFAVQSNGMSLPKRHLLTWAVRRCAEKADAVLTVSAFSASEIQRYVNPRGKVVVAHNGVDIIETRAAAPEGITGRFILGGATSLPHKNLETLIKALRLLNKGDTKVSLVLFGPESSYQKSLRRLAHELGLDGSVFFTGYVSNEELAGLYRSAEAFVFPSLYEGFGLPVVEAMAYGTPVICSRMASLPEIAGDAALYLNDPHDEAELAQRMEMLLQDATLRKELVEAGYRRREQFTWRKTAEVTYQVYREVLGR